MHRLVVTGEADLGIGDHRHVNAKVRAPVVMHVDMLGHDGPGLQPHEAAAAPSAVQLGHDLFDVAATFKRLGGFHRSSEIVVHRAANTDQRDRSIPVKLPRMLHPGALRKGGDFARQGFRAKPDGQFQERLLNSHSLRFLWEINVI